MEQTVIGRNRRGAGMLTAMYFIVSGIVLIVALAILFRFLPDGYQPLVVITLIVLVCGVVVGYL
jgi:ABC-type Fe3+ transport system permease subunit